MGPRGVIPNGRIYLEGRVIKAVGAVGEALPADFAPLFANAPKVATGGTIFPGLIELHNHLSYNAMPLWEVPTQYSNNGQWRGGEDYSRRITKPSQVLGQSPGVLQALVRYVECRAMLGGVTTTQGITLANASSLTKHYKGLVRNVESPGDKDLPAANTNIANPDVGGAEAYLTKLNGQKGAYLQHLSEGTDPTARGWFLRLKRANGSFAVTHALSGIHSAALIREDFDVLKAADASMVWSPLSNYLLYGETANLKAAEGVRDPDGDRLGLVAERDEEPAGRAEGGLARESGARGRERRPGLRPGGHRPDGDDQPGTDPALGRPSRVDREGSVGRPRRRQRQDDGPVPEPDRGP